MSYRDSLQLLPILIRFYQATCRLETRIQLFQLIARGSRCVPCCAAVTLNCVESRGQSGHMMSRIRFRLRMAGAKSWETPHDELSRNTSILTLHIGLRPLFVFRHWAQEPCAVMSRNELSSAALSFIR